MATRKRWPAAGIQLHGWAAEPLRRLRLALLGALWLLSACGSDPTPSESAPTASPTVAGSTQPSPEPTGIEPASRRAEAALRAQRLFAPAGDNAFELFLQAVDEQPADERSRTALQDLLPYAVLHVEQRLVALDRVEAARVLGLLRRAQPEAPALPRLQRALQALPADAREQVATPLAAPEPAPLPAATAVAAESAAPPTAAPPVTDRSDPAPPSQPPALPLSPEPTAASVAAEAAPETQRPSPAVAATGDTAEPRSDALPRALRQVAPKYPPVAGRRRQEGQVEVAFTINPDGRVSDVQVLSSDPPRVFDRAAMAAMEDWRFEAPGRSIRSSRTFLFRMD